MIWRIIYIYGELDKRVRRFCLHAFDFVFLKRNVSARFIVVSKESAVRLQLTSRVEKERNASKTNSACRE